jgi:2-succinyl-6-hydroxy-2,4-cyclohexadiene-1-carboxylate synthase
MVLFIPGFMQRGDAWRPVAELLPTRYPSILLDHREHSFEGRLREIAEQGERRVLVGYSLGGRLAPRAALRDPGRYTGLVTLGATAGIDDPGLRSTRAEADERLAAWMEAAPIADIVGVWERQPLFADQSETLIEEQRAGRLTHDPKGLAMMLRTAGQGVLEPVWHELLTFQLPLLAIAGARDEGYTAAAKRMAETAPRGQAAIVEEAGHAAQLQRPDEVARLIEAFVAGTGATRQPNSSPPIGPS